MEIVEHPNMTDFKCPICGTNEDKPVVLIPIAGTEVPESRRIKAEQVHIECIDLTIVNMILGHNDLWLVQRL